MAAPMLAPSGRVISAEKRAASVKKWLVDHKIDAARLTPAGTTIRYTITPRQITAEIWRGELLAPAPRSARLRWVDPRRPGVALTALAKKVAALWRVR